LGGVENKSCLGAGFLLKCCSLILIQTMKPLHWDAINPITGTPFTWDDPNLRWGSPSYYLEPGDAGFVPYATPVPVPPAKKKKPFHRRAKLTNIEPTPTKPTMSAFKYNTRQGSQGGYTTSAVKDQPIGDTELLTHIATDAATTPQIVEAVLRGFVHHITHCSAGCIYSNNFLGLLRFFPTSGGSSPSPDGFQNAADINADIAITLTADVIRTWQETLTLEHMGELGRVLPNIDSIISQANGALNKYTPGDLIQIRGNNLKFDRADVQQGLFLKPAAGAEVRCTAYSDIEPQTFTAIVPAALSGPLTARMVAKINGSLRTFTYGAPVTE
jgi:hypothetical protein